MVTKTTSGCECQPSVPPGAMVPWTTATSVALPSVSWIFASSTLNGPGPVSYGPTALRARICLSSPESGVAIARLADARLADTTTMNMEWMTTKTGTQRRYELQGLDSD